MAYTKFVKLICLISGMLFLGCGMSSAEMETAKKHFRETAELQCKCDKIKAQKDSKPEDYSTCVRDYESAVKYMKDFFDVVKPTDSQRSEASKAGDEVIAGCKKN